MPCPALVEAVRQAKTMGIPVEPLDMCEELFEEAFTTHVSTVDIVRMDRPARYRRLARKRLGCRTPKELAIEWDRLTRGSGGYRRLERARERYMAKRISALTKRYTRLLVLMDVARAAGVRTVLESQGTED